MELPNMIKKSKDTLENPDETAHMKHKKYKRE